MLQKIIEEDIIVSYLIERTGITRTQLDTLLISLKEDLELDDMRSLRDGGNVSKGSFIRTLRQAQKKLEKSFYTLIIFEYLSILDKNNTLSLVRLGDVLKEAKTRGANNEDIQRMLNQMSTTISNICRR
jgi:hypothetical protein